MDVQTIALSSRTVIGKKVKRLRDRGIIPVHVYGSDIAPMSLQTDAQVLDRILPRVGTNIPLSVEIDGQTGENICFVREVQRDPVSEQVLHVDFLRVDVSRSITAEVPVVLLGSSPAVRELGGVLLQPLQAILVESLPMNVPPFIEVDISGLDDFEKTIHVSEVSVDASVTILNDSEELIVRVSPPRIEVEEEEEVEEEAPEGAEAEGEEGAAEEDETEG